MTRNTIPGTTLAADTAFACRVRVESAPVSAASDGESHDLFVVEMRGVIGPCRGEGSAILQVTIEDVTVSQTHPVLARNRPGTATQAQAFVLRTELTGLTAEPLILADWTTATRVDRSWLSLPRKGRRQLRFHVTLEAGQDRQSLADGSAATEYLHTEPGYLDLAENTRDVRTLAVPLGMAVATFEGDLPSGAMGLIRGWALTGIDLARTSHKARLEFEKSLRDLGALFLDGEDLDLATLCQEILNVANPGARIDVLDFCIQVAQGTGSIRAETLGLLDHLAARLQIDPERSRTLMEKTFGLAAIETAAPQILLGLRLDMSKEDTLRQLNKEYAKWNARVTHTDATIRAQAERMLQLVAQTRNQVIG